MTDRVSLVQEVVEWAIEKLGDHPDTKTARDILRKELRRYELKAGL